LADFCGMKKPRRNIGASVLFGIFKEVIHDERRPGNKYRFQFSSYSLFDFPTPVYKIAHIIALPCNMRIILYHIFVRKSSPKKKETHKDRAGLHVMFCSFIQLVCEQNVLAANVLRKILRIRLQTESTL